MTQHAANSGYEPIYAIRAERSILHGGQMPPIASEINHKPQTINRRPLNFQICSPRAASFSIATIPDKTAMVVKLITPPTNKTIINAQQQPIHYWPCLNPIWNAPKRPECQSGSKKPIGVRHL